MNIAFQIEITPDTAAFAREMTDDAAAIEKEVIRELVELAPAEMRDLMGNNPPAPRGSAPARRTGTLAASIQPIGADAIAMIDYSRYLDPFLGGNLDRPFVLEGVERALVKVAGNL